MFQTENELFQWYDLATLHLPLDWFYVPSALTHFLHLWTIWKFVLLSNILAITLQTQKQTYVPYLPLAVQSAH